MDKDVFKKQPENRGDHPYKDRMKFQNMNFNAKRIHVDGVVLYHPCMDKDTYDKGKNGQKKTLRRMITDAVGVAAVKSIMPCWHVHSHWVKFHYWASELDVTMVKTFERLRLAFDDYIRELLDAEDDQPLIVEICRIDYAVNCDNGFYMYDPEKDIQRFIDLTKQWLLSYEADAFVDCSNTSCKNIAI